MSSFEQATSTNWLGVWACFCAGLAAAMTMNKASPAALLIANDLQLSLFQMGWVVSVVAVATVLLGVVSGHLVRRYGALSVLIFGLVILLFSPLLGFFASQPSHLLLGRSFEGLGVIFIMVAAPASIIQLTIPKDIGLSMGIWALWMPCGGSLIFLIAPWVLNMGGWRMLWLSTTVATALILPLLTYLIHSLPGKPASAFLSGIKPDALNNKKTERGFKLLIKLPETIWLAVIFACFTSVFFGIITYLPTYLHTERAFSMEKASLLTALLPVVLIAGNLVCGALIHRGFNPLRIIGATAILMSLSLAITVLSGEGVQAIILLTIFGFVTGIIPTALFAQAPQFALAPAAAGMVIGVMVTGQGLGILLMPPVIAYLVGSEYQWMNAIPLLLVLPLLVSSASFYLLHLERRSQ